jgi:hypothetical protein
MYHASTVEIVRVRLFAAASCWAPNHRAEAGAGGSFTNSLDPAACAIAGGIPAMAVRRGRCDREV